MRRDSLIIIPAYNEEENIHNVLEGIKIAGVDADILVVNDGSTDRTERAALGAGAAVITHPFNLGYGGALQTGFKYAVKKGYKYVVQFDGDGQHNAEDLNMILDRLSQNSAEIVIGSRFKGNGTLKTGFVKMIAIHLFRFLIKFFTGTKITDPTSGLKGLSRQAFLYFSRMGRYPVDFPDADVLIQIIRCKYRIVEIPANMRAREAGVSMHSGLKPIYYFFKIMLSIAIVLLREKFAGEACDYNE